MKNLLFVDHKFHESTKSSDFFIEILRRRFAVDQFFVDPDVGDNGDLLEKAREAQIIVVWQMDYLASAFCALGKPTIVIPMYDGSSTMPDMHWALLRKATFINFSRAMHERVRLMGCRSYLVKYFVQPCARKDMVSFENINVFFWQRRPDHGINIQLVDKMLGETCDRIHLHDAPDIDLGHDNEIIGERNYELTKSIWFSSRAAYEEVLRSCNVFVCPRAAEGIGVAMLEAMARGMVVIANDQPTHNEYISNWVNGILFNIGGGNDTISLRGQSSRIGYSAWKSVEFGHQRWNKNINDILDLIDNAPASDLIKAEPSDYLHSLCSSFSAGQQEYVRYIQSKAHVMGDFTGGSLDDVAILLGGAQIESNKFSVPSISSDRSLPISEKDCPFLYEGWSSYEDGGYRWIEGKYATVRFSDTPSSEVQCLNFAAKSVNASGTQQFLSVILNRNQILAAPLPEGDFTNFLVRLPKGAIAPVNIIEIKLEVAERPHGDGRFLSACFSDLKFVPLEEGLKISRSTESAKP
ncbi:glycosyltransferase [Methylobacterium sp. Leaf361]|uniref:glycosyltransferase n=1 Tax=Methylobacterium sp. Leaf361 TaxID=1736352 RepID=UPI0009EA9296|nr:glycosyltransferase [Methylobacterium sp. Leaf361]